MAIGDALIDHFLRYHLINPAQFGFVLGWSTVSQLISCSGDWIFHWIWEFRLKLCTLITLRTTSMRSDTESCSWNRKNMASPDLLWSGPHHFYCGRTFQIRTGNGAYWCTSRKCLRFILSFINVTNVSDNILSIIRLFAGDLKIYGS